MTAAMPVVWSDAHRLHEPGGEVWVGVRTPAVEVPARADAIRARARGRRRIRWSRPTAHDDAALEAVHDPALLAFLAGALGGWDAAGLPDDPGQDRVVPYFFPHPGAARDDRRPPCRSATWARTGYFAFDTMTLVGPGTWEAARGGVDAALTAADLVAGGAPAAYACCRPPGHHVTRAAYGGSCYLNNAAVAAAALRDRLGDRGRGRRHRRAPRQRHPGDLLRPRRRAHGLRPRRPGARAGSRTSSASRARRGEGAGAGANRNLPLAPGSRRRAVARGGRTSSRGWRGHGAARARRRARRRRGGRRPGEPARR